MISSSIKIIYIICSISTCQKKSICFMCSGRLYATEIVSVCLFIYNSPAHGFGQNNSFICRADGIHILVVFCCTTMRSNYRFIHVKEVDIRVLFICMYSLLYMYIYVHIWRDISKVQSNRPTQTFSAQ